MPWKIERRKGKYVVIREGGAGKVVGTHDTEAQAEKQRRALYASEYWLKKAKKKRFASRSEAARYAASIRWQNNRSGGPAEFGQIQSSEYMALQREFEMGLPSHRGALRLSEREMAAKVLSDYLESATSINTYLRSTTEGRTKPEIEAFISSFDSLAVPLPKDATLFRGVADENQFIPQNLGVGQTFIDKGIVSTSINEQTAAGFSSGEQFGQEPKTGTQLIEIRVPQNTPILAPENRFHDWEGEILLKPGTQFRLVSTEILPSRRGGTYSRSVVEVVADDAMMKARARMFASRSEAGRYAAHIRWANARGEQPMSLEQWRTATALPATPDVDAIPMASTEAGRMLQTLLDPHIDPETGELPSGNKVEPVIHLMYYGTTYAQEHATFEERAQAWAEKYDADPSLYFEAETPNFLGDKLVPSSPDLGMYYQVGPPFKPTPLDAPHLWNEQMLVSLQGYPRSESGAMVTNPERHSMVLPDVGYTETDLRIRRFIAESVNNSPANPDGLRMEDLVRWERPSMNVGSGFSYSESLGYFASLKAGYGEPYGKPDYSWVDRGEGRASDGTLQRAANHILAKINEAIPGQPGLWRGETRRADYESIDLAPGDTFKLGMAGFSGSAQSAKQYAREGVDFPASGFSSYRTETAPRMYYLEPGAKGVKIPASVSNFPHDHEVLTSGTFRVKAVEVVKVPNTSARTIIDLKQRRIDRALADSQVTSREHAMISAQLKHEAKNLPAYNEYEVVTISQETLP